MSKLMICLDHKVLLFIKEQQLQNKSPDLLEIMINIADVSTSFTSMDVIKSIKRLRQTLRIIKVNNCGKHCYELIN